MNSPRLEWGGQGLDNDIGKLCRCFDRRCISSHGDSLYNPLRHHLLAIVLNDPFQLFFRKCVDNIVSGEPSALIHAHIEGSVQGKAETPACCLQLMSRNPQVEQDAVNFPDVQRGQDRIYLCEISLYKDLSVAKGF